MPKELPAIAFACEKFKTYVYGSQVSMDSDQKLLEMICQKPIHTAQNRLQQMLLRLQKFHIKIQYKKGTEMYLADTQ